MSIIRRHKQDKYTTVSNEIYQDPNISAKAKGLHIYLMTLPNDWVIRKTEIPKHFSDGKCSIFSAFDELVKNGYITETHEGGKDEGLKRTSYDIYEFRFSAPVNSASENQQLQNTKEQNTKNKYPLTPKGGTAEEEENEDEPASFTLTANPMKTDSLLKPRETGDCLETLKPSEFLNRFNEVSPKKARHLSTGRAKKLAARMKCDLFADNLDELFKRIKGSAFLQGENDRGWQMDIDWLLANDTNYVKILEGKYDNSRFKRPEADEGPQQPDARIAPKELKGWQDFVTAQCKAGEYDPERLEEFLSGGWDRLPPYIKSEFRDFQTQ